MTLKNTIQAIVKENPYAIILINGDSLCGDFRSFKCPDTSKMIFIKDVVPFESAIPSILSQDLYILRSSFQNNIYFGSMLSDSLIYPVEDNVVLSLGDLSECKQSIKKSTIVLVQYDCCISQIWQLTMEAYIEHLGINDHIQRVCFDKDINVSRYDRITVNGAQEAYYQLVCQHRQVDLSEYLITPQAVQCYLDIHLQNGVFYNHICNISSRFENPHSAYFAFIREFPEWGLDLTDFMKIAMKVFSDNPLYIKTAEKWRYL